MTKIVAETDPLQKPEVRGKRLRQLRQMSGLSRQALENKYKINAKTLQSWESGNAGGLTPRGAMRVVYAMSEEKIHVTKEWLLYGAGIGPQWLNLDSDVHGQVNLQPLDFDQETAVRQELLIFRQYNSNPIDMRIADDGMEPHYLIGDYIGGKQRFADEIANCVNRDCIVETSKGELLFRRLKVGNKPGLYTLYCVNPNTSVREPVLHDIELKSAAPVIWQRRRDI